MLRYALGFALLTAAAGAQSFDLILENARVVDGAGNPWYRADVGIRDGRIAAIGDLAGRPGRRIILGGRVVSPGFIDLMGGTSYPLLADPATAGSKLCQGITTALVGEGGSAAPQSDRTMPAAAAQAGQRWRTFAEYFRLLEARGLPMNVVHNVGAAQVRQVVIGDEDRAPSAAEMERMRALVEEAMRDGAAGVSTALIYPPGTYARTPELVELAKAAARFGGFYSTHIRNESGGLLAAVGEALEIGAQAGLPVHIYHLKAAGRENWPLMQKAIDAIGAARAGGQDVTADIYPYIRNGLGLEALVHPRYFARGGDAFRRSLEDPAARAAMRREIETTSDWENWYRHVGQDWDKVLVAQTHGNADRAYEGKSVAEIARLRGEDPWTTFFFLLGRGHIEVNPESMDEAQKHLALRSEFIAFCTDSEPLNPATATGAHPRGFGAFPRVLARYVREERVLSLEAAIRKMTSLAANRLKLYDRGRIAPGMAADLVVFDPATIQDTATFTAPMQYPRGIDYVLVNGRIAVERGAWTKEMAGRVLRAGNAAAR